MKRYFLLWLLFLLSFVQLSFGQEFSEEQKNELNIANPGVDFVIGCGIYMGGAKPAGYYGGYPQNELTLNYVFRNEYWKKEILKLITDHYNFVSSTDTTIGIRDYPDKVHYQPAMSVCIGASYRFDEHWRINIYYTFARQPCAGERPSGVPFVPSARQGEPLFLRSHRKLYLSIQ